MAIIKKTTNNKCWQGSGEKEPLAFGGNVSWHYWPLWKTIWRSLKKLKTELPYDPSVPLLGTYLKKMKTLTQEDTCIPMFSAALFTKAKIWKQPKYQWQMKRSLKCDRQLHTHVLRAHTHTHTNNGTLFSLWKRSCLEQHKWTSRITLSEKSQTQILNDLTYMWNLKTKQQKILA